MFVVSGSAAPHASELSNENMLRILHGVATDQQVNKLVWKCLGYRAGAGTWESSECFPKWRDRFPEPPDLIGLTRVFTKEVRGAAINTIVSKYDPCKSLTTALHGRWMAQ